MRQFVPSLLLLTIVMTVPTALVAQPNDLCTGAFNVGPGAHAYDSTGAGFDPFGVKISCWDVPVSPSLHDVWFLYTVAATGDVQITATTTHATVIGLYNSTTCASGVLATDEVTCETSLGASTVLTHSVVAGEQFYVRLAGIQGGGTPIFGPGVLNIVELPSLANDNCTSPTPLTLPGSFSYSNAGGTESAGFTCDRNEDVWFVVQPAITGELVVSTYDNFGEHTIYAGPGGPTVCPGDLDQIGGCDQLDSITPVTAGNTYFIRVGPDIMGDPLNGEIVALVRTALTNDDCTTPTPLSVGSTTWVSSAGATPSVGLTCNSTLAWGDIWFEVTPASSGTLTSTFTSDIEPINPTADPAQHAVYQVATAGTCPTDVDQIVCSDMGTVNFAVVAGETYLIRLLDESTQHPLIGELTITLGTANPNDDCSLPFVVGALPASVAIDTTGATADALLTGCSPMNEDVWYAVTPPTNGVLIAAASGSIEATLAIYLPAVSGSCPSSGDELSCGQFPLVGNTVTSAAVVGGETYLIRVSDRTGSVAATGLLDVTLAPPLPNDDCSTPTPVSLGTTAASNGGATVDTTGLSCTQGPDVWYEFLAPSTGTMRLDLTASVAHAIYALPTGPGFCPVDADELECNPVGVSVAFSVTLGESYAIRLGKNEFFAVDMTISNDCDPLTGLTCSYDCVGDNLNLSWNTGAYVNYTVDSSIDGNLASAAALSTLSLQGVTNGLHTITVTGECANGGFASQSCDVLVANSANAGVDVILALEGLSTGGNVGAIDSVSALDAALLGNGATTTVLTLNSFTTFLCLDAFIDNAERVWVLTGTFPNNYLLSATEADYLAGKNAAGIAIYLEGSDHWSFAAPSLLDGRDGVGPSSAGGDDTLTSLDGADSGLADGDFSAQANVGYNQDNLSGTDSTDQLDLTAADAGVSSGAIWQRDDLLDPYVVAVHAIHDTDGGRMVSSSFEFGGFSGDQAALAASYTVALSGPASPPYRRGDANGDGSINIADAVYLLGHLFPIGVANVLECVDAADANADGAINIADAVAVLTALFGSPPLILPFPYPDCGSAFQLGCGFYPGCP